MIVRPVPDEPGRFLVQSDTEGLPWLVDLFYRDEDFGNRVFPTCACWISYNRTANRRGCHHIDQARAFHFAARASKLATASFSLRRSAKA